MSSYVSQGGVIVGPPPLGPYSVKRTCPSCRAEVMTTVNFVPGLLTWCICGICCLLGYVCMLFLKQTTIFELFTLSVDSSWVAA